MASVTGSLNIDRVGIAALLTKIKGGAEKGLRLLCEETVGLAKRPPPKGSPIQYGHNRDSINFEVIAKVGGWHARVFTSSGYGGYLELGTSKMAARPYLYPSAVEALKSIQAHFEKGMK